MLAAQLAYNCGINRTINRINSLGGWENIFSVPEGQAGGLPNETANYGYQFIKFFLQTRTSYKTHIIPSKHLKLCVMALLRSKEYKKVEATLLTKKMRQYNKLIKTAILLKQAPYINNQHIDKLREVFNEMPDWPLVLNIRQYLSFL